MYKVTCEECGWIWEQKTAPFGIFAKKPTNCPKCGHIGGIVDVLRS